MSDTDDELEALLQEVAGVGDAAIAPGAHLVKGTLVTERVRLVELLGRGGMGSVWVADHLTLDRRVAVKFVQRGDDATLQRFSREAKLAAQLDSPHAVRVFDYGLMDEDVPFLVMELLEGESLAQRLASAARMPLSQVKTLVEQVAQVLREAHGLGIVHRDIKPANLFLARSDYEVFAKVLDFGIAKRREATPATGVTGSGVLMGTPLYMAPEQLVDGEPANTDADLWALSAVAYEALTGQPPFAGKTVASLGAALSRREIEPPSTLAGELPKQLDAFFERAFARDAADRFSDAAELAAAFAAAVGEQAEVSVPTSMARPSAMVAGGGRVRWLMGAAAAAVAVGVAVSLTTSDEPPPTTPSASLDASASAPTVTPMSSTTSAPVLSVRPASSRPPPAATSSVPRLPAVTPRPRSASGASASPAASVSSAAVAVPAPLPATTGSKGGLITDAPF